MGDVRPYIGMETQTVEGKPIEALARSTWAKQVADRLDSLKLGQYTESIIDRQGYSNIDVLAALSEKELEEIAATCGMKAGHKKKFVSEFATTPSEAPKPDKPERSGSFYERREREERRERQDRQDRQDRQARSGKDGMACAEQ